METIENRTASHISRREVNRLAAGRAAWVRAHESLRRMGVAAEMFGSMARGDVHDRSDLDALILDRNGHSRGAILRVIEDEADDIPVDIIFAEDIPARKVVRMREEATCE